MSEPSRILIVDDEPHNIKVLTDYLRPEHKIMAVKSGEQALKVLKGPKLPGLILLDIMMPGIDGYEVCKRLKADPALMHIPVIFITAMSNCEQEVKGFELGAVDFITKPFNPVVVKARITTHLQLKRKTDLLERLASLDGLTGIPNRRSFNLTLDREIRRAARNGSDLSLILMDIDYFKQYNDRYGHLAGDTCLRQVAQVLDNLVKRASDFVARYGGEEFALILPETGCNEALRIAESVHAAVAQLKIPHAASRVAKTVSLSLGVASLKPDPGITADGMVDAADTSFYQAKQNGRNQTYIAAGDQQT
jgi:diguanylate cyclase (GGDEF)-like protein